MIDLVLWLIVIPFSIAFLILVLDKLCYLIEYRLSQFKFFGRYNFNDEDKRIR